MDKETCEVPCKAIQAVFEKKAFVPFSWFAWVIGGIAFAGIVTVTTMGGMLFGNQKEIKAAINMIDKTVAVNTVKLQEVKESIGNLQYEVAMRNGNTKVKIGRR